MDVIQKIVVRKKPKHLKYIIMNGVKERNGPISTCVAINAEGILPLAFSLMFWLGIKLGTF